MLVLPHRGGVETVPGRRAIPRDGGYWATLQANI